MKNQKATLTVKTIASCALLAAISIVMARLLSFATPDGVRWSADKFPLFLAGMLFGPLMGAVTGFVADLLGSIMQFGFNPSFARLLFSTACSEVFSAGIWQRNSQ